MQCHHLSNPKSSLKTRASEKIWIRLSEMLFVGNDRRKQYYRLSYWISQQGLRLMLIYRSQKLVSRGSSDPIYSSSIVWRIYRTLQLCEPCRKVPRGSLSHLEIRDLGPSCSLIVMSSLPIFILSMTRPTIFSPSCTHRFPWCSVVSILGWYLQTILISIVNTIEARKCKLW